MRSTMSDDAWRAGISRNLDTAFFVTRAALRPMLAAGYGRVVNVASITGPGDGDGGQRRLRRRQGGDGGTDPLPRGRGGAVAASPSTPCVQAGSPPRRRPRTSTGRGCAPPWAGQQPRTRSRARWRWLATPARRTSPVRRSSSTAATRSPRSACDAPGRRSTGSTARSSGSCRWTDVRPTPTLRARSACRRRLSGNACSG